MGVVVLIIDEDVLDNFLNIVDTCQCQVPTDNVLITQADEIHGIVFEVVETQRSDEQGNLLTLIVKRHLEVAMPPVQDGEPLYSWWNLSDHIRWHLGRVARTLDVLIGWLEINGDPRFV